MPKPREFERRRRQLMRTMGEDAVAIVPAAPERRRNRDIFYPYRQDSDFWYLTGFPEPEAVAVIVPGRAEAEFILFCRERDPQRETWDGLRAGQEGACRDYGADDAFPITDIDEILPGLMEGRERVYCTMGRDTEFDQRLIGWVNDLRERSQNQAGQEIVALDHVLQDMRTYKSREELRAMKRAAAISVGAMRRAMRACRPGMMEYEIEAELQYEYRRHGTAPAYPAIVGGGANACILHYIENNAPLNDGELLLIDAGCEYGLYAADITRTFPVNGRFTADQRDVYEWVLAAQEAAFAEIAPGRTWNDSHAAAVRVLTQGLVELGILQGEVDELVESGAYRRFYMHRTGHWIGLDVHDVGEYRVDGHWRELEPGMTLTVEPGLYIPAGSEGVDERWWNIGVRIEDDVAVTRDGYELLTPGLPRTPEEVESEMSAAHAA